MEYQVIKQDKTFVITVSGKMTYKDHEIFRELALLLGDNGGEMELDVNAVAFIDSAAIGMLLILHDEAERRGASLRVNGGTGQVRRIFIATDIVKALKWKDIPDTNDSLR